MSTARRARPALGLAGVRRLLAAALLCAPAASLGAQAPRVRQVAGLPLVRVPAGDYRAQYAAPGAAPVRVSAFLLMTRPVTNAEFAEFVAGHPGYRRDRIARVFADERYLSHWAEPDRPGQGARGQQPVTHVSWFAAKAFCESRGLRLPTEDEWELAAAASETERDARSDPRFQERVLAWYGKPAGALPDVPHAPANLYGARDLHGVVWEWVLDFNNARAIADSRDQAEGERGRFCGEGSLLASDSMDYAAFMRFAMRSSLQAHYTTANLGFRCAADARAKRKESS